MKRFLIFFGFVVALIVSISSCNNDNNLKELEQEEMRLLEAYLDENHPDATALPSGLYVLDIEDGGNDTLIGSGDEVQIYYTGKLLANGFVFDTNIDSLGRHYEPLRFVVGNNEVISGMDEGMTYLKVGDKATLIIPSRLGYKATNNGNIPRFSTLIFDIEVYKHIRLEDR